MKFLFLTAALLLSVSAFATPTTIILSRHAEKQKGDNPELTDEGKKRAKTLKELAHVYDFAGVYSSDTKRTVGTAKPLAEEVNLKVNTTFAPDNFKGMTDDIVAKYAGKTVLVVGHSNTIPGFLNYLTGSKIYKDFDDNDFSNLFVVQYDGPGKAIVQRFNQRANEESKKLILDPRSN